MDDTIDLPIKKSFVKKQACFQLLSDKEMDELAGLLVERHFTTGETIVTEGDLVDNVFLIVRGEADVRVATIKNHVQQFNSVATLKMGAAIGLNETGFYSLSGKRTATVVAITDMVVLQLSVAKFHGFALAYPHVNEVMRKSAAQFDGSSASKENN
jgi:CRP-like cAMP-binding protein